MDMNTVEAKTVEASINVIEQSGEAVREIGALELVLVGGGCGDVQF